MTPRMGFSAAAAVDISTSWCGDSELGSREGGRGGLGSERWVAPSDEPSRSITSETLREITARTKFLELHGDSVPLHRVRLLESSR